MLHTVTYPCPRPLLPKDPPWVEARGQSLRITYNPRFDLVWEELHMERVSAMLLAGLLIALLIFWFISDM